MELKYNDVIRRRVLNCAWKAYSPDDTTAGEYINSVVDKYHYLLNNNWKKQMYDAFNINFSTNLKKKVVTSEINRIISDKLLIKENE